MSRSGSEFDALVLAGGRSRRMGGRDKTALALGGMPLLDRALEAVAAATKVVVVGPPRPTARTVAWTREVPPGGGPAAALAAGLTQISASVVAVLAADLPFVTPGVVAALVREAQPSGAVLVDDDGAPQWLLGAWPVGLLRAALAGDQAGRSLRAALAPLNPALVKAAGALPAWFDCDRPADVAAAKELLDERPG